jgi:hypothetical protein
MRWKSTVLDWKAALSAVMSQRRRPCPLADVPTGEDRQALPEGGRPRLPEQERSIFRPMADWIAGKAVMSRKFRSKAERDTFYPHVEFP